jgi:hypothetical protein
MGLGLSLLAFVASFLAGRRSLGAGCAVVLVFGYGFGIIRARYYDTFSFFVFDAGVLGLYLAWFTGSGTVPASPNTFLLRRWATVLIAWPLILFGLCLIFPQHPLIQLVGLRAAIWYLPFLLLGIAIRPADLTTIARALAVLNLAALGFALGEYFLGLEVFYPRNPITELIYRSSDVAGHTAYRIPATFSTSAGYGATMVATIPLLGAVWASSSASRLDKLLMVAGLLAASLGAFVCGSRSPVIFLIVLAAVIAFELRARLGYLLLVLLVAGVVAYVVSGEARFQRFTTLQDPDVLSERISVSVNLGVFEVLARYPLGAGLGSAFGTNIPPILRSLAHEQVGVENEYARIAVEQGWIGLIVWLSFLIWLLTRRRDRTPMGGKLGSRLMYCFVLASWLNALFGTGTLAAIPGTALLLLQMTMLSRSASPPIPAARSLRRIPAAAAAPPVGPLANNSGTR